MDDDYPLLPFKNGLGMVRFGLKKNESTWKRKG
jgi:hypothetical protein